MSWKVFRICSRGLHEGAWYLTGSSEFDLKVRPSGPTFRRRVCRDLIVGTLNESIQHLAVIL